jgi:hypothetical protein
VSFDQAPIEKRTKLLLLLDFLCFKGDILSAWSKDTSAALGLRFAWRARKGFVKIRGLNT